QLALAWCNQVDGVTSTIIGATNISQLQDDIKAFSMPLNEQALIDIESVFKAYPVPF
ncbi:MAG: aryl-alcohol dehydrogenase-like predicted oxidoreductase, partial [Sphingobacteriales bacterium]